MAGMTLQTPRVGFFKRLLALLLDMVIVIVPLQLIIAALFALTNGAIQGSGSNGISATVCMSREQLPEALDPPVPTGFNSVSDCSVSFFGIETSRYLVVSVVTQDGGTTTSISQFYWLGRDGLPRADVFDTDWIVELIFFFYCVLAEYRFGATIGKRAASIKVVDIADPDRTGIPFPKALGRQIGLYFGTLVIVGASYIGFPLLELKNGVPHNMGAFITVFVIAGMVDLIWMIWIVISIAKKRDPIYDRLVGTAVVYA